MQTVADAVRRWLAHQEERTRTPKPVEAGHEAATVLHPESYRKLVLRGGHLASSRLGRTSLEALAAATNQGSIRDQQAPFFAYRDERLAAGVAPLSVRQELSYLFAILKFARDQRWWAGRLPPLRDLVLGLHVRQRPRYTPTDDEVARVLAGLAGWKRLFVLLAFGTGARREEIARLRWQDVDWARSALLVRGKGGRNRVVLVEHGLLAELAQWRDHGTCRVRDGGSRTARVRTEPSSPVLGPAVSTVKAEVSAAIGRVCDDAGIPRWTAHGLRRLRVAWLKAAGVHAIDAAYMMGHSPEVMAEIYAETTLEDQAVALDRIGAARKERADRRARQKNLLGEGLGGRAVSSRFDGDPTPSGADPAERPTRTPGRGE